MKIAICDDIRIHAEELSGLVSGYYGATAEVSIFDSGKSLLQSMATVKFDLIFLDVLMPGQDGIQAAKIIRDEHEDIPIVFVSSSLENSVKGYQVDAVAYILKPADKNELKQALDRLEKQRARRINEHITVLTNEGAAKIPAAEILTIEKIGRNTKVTRINKSDILTKQPISELTPQIKRLPQFEIFSYSNYINMSNVTDFNKKQRLLYMRNGSTVHVSRERINDLLDIFLLKYTQE